MNTLRKEDVLKMNPSDIRHHYRAHGHFFERSTMKFFGDTMASYGVRTLNGERFMYRKPNATVNVFGDRRRAGRQHFNVWRVVIQDSYEIDLIGATDEEEAAIWEVI